ncbi:MAG: thiamine pyrophosphate-binding protein [bacterium]
MQAETKKPHGSAQAVEGTPVAGAAGASAMRWGSDAVAHVLGELGFPYIALNPGASYRGFHDSLVNFLGNRAPRMLLCLHEEHAVAIAHGYAKVTEEPMAVALHSNVGLMHGAMAIYNAWCDRVPMMILGATGPVDAARRRPWIDWIHTSRDQAALIRHYVKWDDQPGSVQAALESVARANMLARTAPFGPVYVCLDVGLQEDRLPAPPVLPDLARHVAPAPPRADPDAVRAAAELLSKAGRPVVLTGRVSRDEADWSRRVRLVERLGARVITDLRLAAAFPTDHPAHAGMAWVTFSEPMRALLRDADVVLSLDSVDLDGLLKQAYDGEAVRAKVIHASLDHTLINGWSMEHQGLAPVDVGLPTTSDGAVAALLEELGEGPNQAPKGPGPASERLEPHPDGRLELDRLALAIGEAVGERKTTFIRYPLGWPAAGCRHREPLDFLGMDGGAGVGSGPGIAVGAALALRGMGRLPIAILGDGDCLMGFSALWSAAHFRLPLLVVVANNRSFFNDEVHQHRMARERGRPPENRGIGVRLDDPPADFPAMARAMGWAAGESVQDAAQLPAALAEAIRAVEAGACYLLDVRVQPRTL